MKIKFNYLLSLIIIITFVCFPQQKKFLFDNLHAETAGNADWVIDEDSNVPGRYPLHLKPIGQVHYPLGELRW